MPRVVIVGAGRVGRSLARRIKGARLVHHDKLGWALSRAELCILAVPDAAVHLTAQKADALLPKNAAIIHCAGALSLAALGVKRRRGSFHPLVAISDPKDALEGGWVAIAASDAKLTSQLKRLAKTLKLHPFEVPEGGRAAYHAAAVMSAGLLISLLSAAVKAGGVPEEALLALTRSALRGAEARGLKSALTGPIVRGDVSIIKAHLDALPDSARPLYRALSQHALALVRAKLPLGTVSAIDQLLR